MRKICLTRPQLHLGLRDPKRFKFQVQNPDSPGIKPWPPHGLWLSTYDREIGSAWWQWCCWETGWHYSDPFAWYCVLDPNTELALIDSVEDLQNLWEMFGLRNAKMAELNINSFVSRGFDFETMFARGLDGIHLTDNGQSETRFNFELSMNGWDVESTLLFRNRLIFTKRVPLPWIKGYWDPKSWEF